MRVTVVLAVGVDSEMLEAESILWRSKGLFFLPAQTIQEAISRFHAGDFDIVLLDDSISLENRERLLVPAKSKATVRVSLGAYPVAVEVNDGSVPEAGHRDHVFAITPPAASTRIGLVQPNSTMEAAICAT